MIVTTVHGVDRNADGSTAPVAQLGVFSSLELAQAYVAQHSADPRRAYWGYTYEAWELDVPAPLI